MDLFIYSNKDKRISVYMIRNEASNLAMILIKIFQRDVGLLQLINKMSYLLADKIMIAMKLKN